MNIIDLIAVISFALNCIQIGYSFGKDSKTQK